jgi:glycosyltransferase involved in cell wall biosynthesis
VRIGIYSPYLDICGGGEKYVGNIAEVLASENNVEFLVEREPNIGELENRLGLKLAKIGFRAIQVSSPFLSKRNYFFSRLTKSYDLFINQEHFSSIPSKAKLSFSIQEVPPTRLNFPRYNPVHKILFDPGLKTYDKIVTNSNFTKKWIDEWYKRSAEVLYPAVDTKQFIPLSKRNFVLSVGRFFVAGHSKKQFEMIKIFEELSQNGMRDWELHLAGSIDDNIQDRAYLEECREEARGHPIYFHVNASLSVLTELYGKSRIFWCATGLGEDGIPHKMEHFGISTVEAMSAGCVPVVIRRGGQPEIVRDNVDGFCWNSVEELRNLTLKLANDDALLVEMSESSVEKSKDFGMDVFERRARETFLMV